MTRQLTLIMLVVLFIVSTTNCYNILVLFPHPGKSHFLSFVTLFKALAQKGHNVTVVSHFPLTNPIKNYRDVELGGFEQFYKSDTVEFLDLKNLDTKSRLLKYFTFLVLADVGQQACEIGFSSPVLHSFLKETNQFDIILMEYFNSDCFWTVAKQFNAPVVRAHSSTLMPWSSYRYANPTNGAYIPNSFMPFSDRLSFLERVENTVIGILQSAYFNNFVVNKDKSVSMKYFGKQGDSLCSDMMKDSLLLVASQYVVNLPRPLVPNIIEIGGIHIEKPQPLAKVFNYFS